MNSMIDMENEKKYAKPTGQGYLDNVGYFVKTKLRARKAIQGIQEHLTNKTELRKKSMT